MEFRQIDLKTGQELPLPQQFQIQKVANNTDTSIKIGAKIPRKPKLQFHSDNARKGSNFQYSSRIST